MAAKRKRKPRPTLPEGHGPDVLLDVDYEEGLLFLVLKNIGAQPAFDVRVRFSRQLKGVGGQKIISATRIFQALSMLRPDKELRVFLDLAHLLFRRRKRNQFWARVTYRDRRKKLFAERFVHDLDAYRDWGDVQRMAGDDHR